ncbi:DUF4190 domain-containing protein [Agrococcus sp. Ld7]|uniref:DUF4190 domain-containing protein n=1 Tax=Agrococcus sp. Ld7 TaxID=649148 RepID=UPI00386FB907
MTSDAERLRAQQSIAQQSSPVHPQPSAARHRPSGWRAPAQSSSVPDGSPPYAAPSPGFPPQPGPFGDQDAPLIHPAAAQASDVVAYGVPVYRAPVYGPPPQQARGLSITALVLGICSFVFAWTLIVVPIMGMVFGLIALRREPAGKTMATIGLVGSGVGLLWVLLFYLVPFGAFFSALLLSGLF